MTCSGSSWNREIGVAFVTKGRIPERHRKLLAAHAPLVQGRIGLITLDPAVAAAFEPGAATPEVRLAQAAELIGAHVPIEARLDPILPSVSDGADCLEPLCVALAHVGVRKIAASALFLRPAVIGSLRRHVADKVMLGRMLDHFASAESLAIHADNSRVRALPTEAHLEIMERLRAIAQHHGLEVLVCACRTPTFPVVPATYLAAGRLRPAAAANWDYSNRSSRAQDTRYIS